MVVKHDQNMQQFWHTKWCLLRQCFYWRKLQHLLSGWCTYCAWSWCAHNCRQWSLNTGHPASQGVGCSLVSVHCSKCCRFHCHPGTTLCWDTQRVSPWASAPQPSKTYKGNWTWVSLHVMLKYYVTNFKYYCLFVSWDFSSFPLLKFTKWYCTGDQTTFKSTIWDWKEEM